MLGTGMTVEVGEAFCLEGSQKVRGFMIGDDHCVISRSLLDDLSRYVLLSKEADRKEERNFMWRGATVKGVTVTGEGTVSALREFMEALLEKQEDYDRLLNANSALQRAFLKVNVPDGDKVSRESFDALRRNYASEVAEKRGMMDENTQLKARNKALEDENSKLRAQAAERQSAVTDHAAAARKARKRQSEFTAAIALSCALTGMGTSDIQMELASRGLHFSQSMISRMLSVKDERDKERLKDIMQKYPVEFMGIPETAFDEFSERKLKKAEARKARRKASEWGE